MLFTILPAALLALAASSGSPSIPHQPGDNMTELHHVVMPRLFWKASVELPRAARVFPAGTPASASKDRPAGGTKDGPRDGL